MKPSFWALVAALVAALAAPAHGIAGSIDVRCETTPPDSFHLLSDDVAGHVRRRPDGYYAENVTLKLDSLRSGVALRDRQMKDNFLETARFPDAVLKEGKAADGRFQGALSLHGTIKTVTGSFETHGQGFAGHVKINLSDYGIAPASYKGVGLKDEVSIDLALPILSP